jgi:hypothetical protein
MNHQQPSRALHHHRDLDQQAKLAAQDEQHTRPARPAPPMTSTAGRPWIIGKKMRPAEGAFVP